MGMMSRTLLMGGAVLLGAGSARCDVPDRFLGRWDVTLHTPDRDYPSLIEVAEQDGALRVRMVGRWGHARWLSGASLVDGRLRFISPAEEELPKDLVFEAQVRHGRLVGTAGDWTFDAVRAPTLGTSANPRWGKSQRLFDGATLSGWHPRDHAANGWTVNDGLLETPGSSGSDLISDASYGNFKLHAEFRVAKGANSGIYLRGRYEVQIENDPAPEGPTMRTGGVYGYLAPRPPAPRTPGVWHAYDITLAGRRITVALDGRTIIRDEEIPGLTGGALSADEGAPGPIMLQGSESGSVEYRNITVTPAISPMMGVEQRGKMALDQQVTRRSVGILRLTRSRAL